MTTITPIFDNYDTAGRAFHWNVVVLLAWFGVALILLLTTMGRWGPTGSALAS